MSASKLQANLISDVGRAITALVASSHYLTYSEKTTSFIIIFLNDFYENHHDNDNKSNKCNFFSSRKETTLHGLMKRIYKKENIIIT